MAGRGRPAVPIGVNLSAFNFCSDSLLPAIVDALARTTYRMDSCTSN
jgi:hypothetical protein